MSSLRNRTGQSIVEITLMTPLILVALYVPFDFGVTIFTAHITQNVVRDAARVASAIQPLGNTEATALANDAFLKLPQRLTSGSTVKRVTVTFYGSGAATCAQNVEVTAQGTYNFFLYRLMALLGFTVDPGIGITRTTRMRYVHQPATNGGTGSTTNLCTTVTGTGSRE